MTHKHWNVTQWNKTIVCITHRKKYLLPQAISHLQSCFDSVYRSLKGSFLWDGVFLSLFVDHHNLRLNLREESVRTGESKQHSNIALFISFLTLCFITYWKWKIYPIDIARLLSVARRRLRGRISCLEIPIFPRGCWEYCRRHSVRILEPVDSSLHRHLLTPW